MPHCLVLSSIAGFTLIVYLIPFFWLILIIASLVLVLCLWVVLPIFMLLDLKCSKRLYLSLIVCLILNFNSMTKFVKIFSVIVDLLVSVLPVLQSVSKSKDEKK